MRSSERRRRVAGISDKNLFFRKVKEDLEEFYADVTGYYRYRGRFISCSYHIREEKRDDENRWNVRENLRMVLLKMLRSLSVTGSTPFLSTSRVPSFASTLLFLSRYRPSLFLVPPSHYAAKILHIRATIVGHNGSAVASYCTRRQDERNKNIPLPPSTFHRLHLFSRKRVTQLFVITNMYHKLIPLIFHSP